MDHGEAETATLERGSGSTLRRRNAGEHIRFCPPPPRSSASVPIALVDAERRIEDRIARGIGPALKKPSRDRCSRIPSMAASPVSVRLRHPSRRPSRRQSPVRSTGISSGSDLPANLLRAHSSSTPCGCGVRRAHITPMAWWIGQERKLAILAVCASNGVTCSPDALIDTHDRIVAASMLRPERLCREMITGRKAAVRATLKSFAYRRCPDRCRRW